MYIVCYTFLIIVCGRREECYHSIRTYSKYFCFLAFTSCWTWNADKNDKMKKKTSQINESIIISIDTGT